MDAKHEGGSATSKPAIDAKIISPAYTRLALFAGILFTCASVVAFRQVTARYEWHEPYSGADWFFHSLEWNVDAALPRIEGNLKAVHYSPDHTCLWVAGDAGFLAFSADDGQNWDLLQYSAGTFVARPAQAWPCPNKKAPSVESSRHSMSIVPTVFAANRKPIAEFSTIAYLSQSSEIPKAPAQTRSSQGANSSQSKSSQPSENEKSPETQGKQDQGSSQTGGVLRFYPSSHDFGAVQVGQQSRQPFTVSTTTPSAAELSSATIRQEKGQGTGFRIVDTNCARGITSKGCTIVVEFSPETKDDYAALLRISTTLDSRVYTANLSGRGIEGSPVNQQAAQGQERESGQGQTREPEPTQKRKPQNQESPPKQPQELTKKKAREKTKPEPREKTAEADDLQQPPNLVAVVIDDSGNETLTTDKGKSFVTTNGGQTWALSSEPYFESVKSQSPDMGLGQRLKVATIYVYDQWAVGPGGVIFHRDKREPHDWIPASFAALTARRGRVPNIVGSYGRFLAPWYWFALTVSILLCLPLLRPREKLESVASTTTPSLSETNQSSTSEVATQDSKPKTVPLTIGNQVISDKPLEPGEPDALGLSNIAAGLSFFLRNEKTKPPLVLGINGRWGSGKSSLMNLLKKNLEDYGAHPVWFNAWHHQKEEQLLAALLQAVKQQAIPAPGEFSGLLFRAKLLWKRLIRYWFYFALVAAGCILVYRAELYLRSLNFNVWAAISLFARDSNAFKNLVSASGDTVPGPLTIIATVLAILKVASRGLVAFGSNPASLLASVSGSTKARDLDAQTEFRQRFAAEFSDVTRSLGRNQRMLILIDDLDRCRPEKVREVLEAVNFLVSSGDCFVVLGMARDIVEHYVGLSFCKTVDSMKWEALGLSPEQIDQAIQEMKKNPPLARQKTNDGAQDGVPSIELSAKRREFARLYLDKLIQIQVSVPEPTSHQKRALFEIRELKTENVTEVKLRRARAFVAHAHSIIGPVFQFALLTAAIAGFGVLIGNWMKPAAEDIHARFSELANSANKPKADSGVGLGVLEGGSLKPLAVKINDQVAELKIPEQKPQPTDMRNIPAKSSGQDKVAGTTQGNTATQNGAAAEKTEAVTAPPPVPAVSNPRISPLSGALAAWPFSLILLGAFAVTSSALRRMPIRDVTDTQAFTNALEAWHSLVLTAGARNTPRTAKRFQNRVRYLAMRQRANQLGQPLSTGERLLRKIYKAKPMDPAVEQPVVIPEPFLVALAAIDEFQPDWLHDPDKFRRIVLPEPGSENTSGPIEVQQLPVLQKAKRDANWVSISNFEDCRNVYFMLSSEVEESLSAS